MKTITNSQLEDIRRAAKRLKKELGITHSEALERLAKEAGFQDYHNLKKSVSDPRPHQGLVSSADEELRQAPIESGKIWFTLDVKDAEVYDHDTFPKRWGIKEDLAKLNSITNDLETAFPDIIRDDTHPSYEFYSWQRVFSLSLSTGKTLLDVVSYVREIFRWDPIYVFQNDKVYEFSANMEGKDYQRWLKEFKSDEDDSDSVMRAYWQPDSSGLSD
jgi:hypothetical protein